MAVLEGMVFFVEEKVSIFKEDKSRGVLHFKRFDVGSSRFKFGCVLTMHWSKEISVHTFYLRLTALSLYPFSIVLRKAKFSYM